jgi:hypothetical protein
MVGMALSAPAVIDMINGRWRSQILYAGVELGVSSTYRIMRCGALNPSRAKSTPIPLLYRLLRALSSINLLREHDDGRFSISEGGQFLRSDHPQSLRAMALLEEGPVHYAN